MMGMAGFHHFGYDLSLLPYDRYSGGRIHFGTFLPSPQHPLLPLNHYRHSYSFLVVSHATWYSLFLTALVRWVVWA